MIATLLSLIVAAPIELDLSGRTELQTLVDREKGQYLGHVSTLLLEDGKTILCVYPKGHGRGAIVYKRSIDGGKTWSDRLPTPENWSTSLETPTIHRVIDPKTGKKRIILWSGLYPARLAVSEDDGKSWSPLKQVGDWGGIVVMGSVERVSNGDYLAWFHDDGRFFRNGIKATGEFRMFQTRSQDGGLTWSDPRLIWRGSSVHLCEPGAVRSPDGSELALLLRENRRVKNSHVTFSTNEGGTWSAPVEMSQALTGDRHTLRYLPDGRLACVFRDMSNGPWKGDFVLWVGSFADFKNGGSGQMRIRLLDNQDSWDCGYPGLELLPDGTLVATTYGHWTKGEEAYIVSVRIPSSVLRR